MSETTIRHRGGGRDEDGKWVAGSNDALEAFAVAPGGGAEYGARGRSGEAVSAVVFFVPPVDLTNDDELTVRGTRYRIVVNAWRSPRTGRGGLEVLCSSAHG